jgi:hypothetical protein
MFKKRSCTYIKGKTYLYPPFPVQTPYPTISSFPGLAIHQETSIMASHLPSEDDSIKFKQLTKEQIAEFHDKGYLILSDILTDSEASKLAIWTKEVKGTIPAIGTGPMPYMEIDKRGRRVLTVTEVSLSEKILLPKIIVTSFT